MLFRKKRLTAPHDHAAAKQRMLTSSSPFAIREAYNAIRAKLLFTGRGEKCPVFAVTSAMMHDGKTTNACASAMQTVTVGGLSRVYPEKAGNVPDVKLRILGGYELTYSNKPRVLLKQGTTEIEGTWDVEYGYDASKIVNTDNLAPAAFNLWDAPVGKYDVIVGNDTLRQAFTVEQREEPDVWMQINGR